MPLAGKPVAEGGTDKTRSTCNKKFHKIEPLGKNYSMPANIVIEIAQGAAILDVKINRDCYRVGFTD